MDSAGVTPSRACRRRYGHGGLLNEIVAALAATIGFDAILIIGRINQRGLQ
jgi:hypothetical protein